jgi:flagellar motility protein MotE (MotC chaperone)
LKRAIVCFQIVVLLMFLGKIVASVGSLRATADDGENMMTSSVAMAQTPAVPVVQQPPRDIVDDSLKKERSLETALQAKLHLLEQREDLLKTEEQRLLALKRELSEKIDVLRALQQQITAVTETYKTEEGKKIKELAKVYEAMPPAKAGAMLETLDLQTAAGITMNMKRDKAGSIWGYLSPKKAVEITEEITRSLKAAAEKKS